MSDALAISVRNAESRIVQRWMQEIARLQARLTGLDGLTTLAELSEPQLRDNMPGILQALAEALAAEDSAARAGADTRCTTEASLHAATRFRQDVSIEALMQEYQALRHALEAELPGIMGRPLRTAERYRLSDEIDLAVRGLVTAFSGFREEQIQHDARSLSKYLSFLSHELRGNLNSAMLLVELLRRDLADQPDMAESLEDLDLMRRSMLSTVSTMDRFLEAERLRRGKVDVHRQPVRLALLLEDVVRSLGVNARDKGLQLVVDCNRQLEATTDPEVVRTILSNLTANAIKYSNAGRITLHARLQQGVYLEVRDEGAGIAPDVLAELFQPFKRGNSYGQRGIGLGLYIARSAATLLGGSLRAESRLGCGSTFILELPG
ncbi:MAG: sensor histidine kinase [Phycisphaerae bacterium]